MEIKVKDYLLESEIKEIVKDELRFKIRQQFDINNIERIFTNSAYHIVWEEVNKSIDYDMTEMIKNKVIEVINGMTDYSVFRDKGDYIYGRDKDSIAQTYLNQYVEENKNIINEKVIEIMQGLDSDAIRNQLYDLIYQVVEDRIIGKKEE